MTFVIAINIKPAKSRYVKKDAEFVATISDLTEMIHMKLGRKKYY